MKIEDGWVCPICGKLEPPVPQRNCIKKAFALPITGSFRKYINKNPEFPFKGTCKFCSMDVYVNDNNEFVNERLLSSERKKMYLLE